MFGRKKPNGRVIAERGEDRRKEDRRIEKRRTKIGPNTDSDDTTPLDFHETQQYNVNKSVLTDIEELNTRLRALSN